MTQGEEAGSYIGSKRIVSAENAERYASKNEGTLEVRRPRPPPQRLKSLDGITDTNGAYISGEKRLLPPQTSPGV